MLSGGAMLLKGTAPSEGHCANNTRTRRRPAEVYPRCSLPCWESALADLSDG